MTGTIKLLNKDGQDTWYVECKGKDYIVMHQHNDNVRKFLDENIGNEVNFKQIPDPYAQYLIAEIL
jgi:hypothetical protein